MNVHKITLIFKDFESVGVENIINYIENTEICQRYPIVFSIETVDIGEWTDEHPLNNNNFEEEVIKIFPSLKKENL